MPYVLPLHCTTTAVSPLFRTHGKTGTTRRMWLYPDVFVYLKQAMQLRAVLAPTFYTGKHGCSVNAHYTMSHKCSVAYLMQFNLIS